MKKMRKKGITLISLVVTIIVMLILAGITVNLVLNENNGIFNTAQHAKEENSKQTATEKINLKITNSQMSSWAELQRMPTLQELADDLCEDNEIEYVKLESQKLASLDKIEVGENDSFFTKLKDYPYEFEINSSLQLASIDGIKIATTNNNTPKEYGYFYNEVMENVASGTKVPFSKIEGNMQFDENEYKVLLKANKHYHISFSARTYDESDYGDILLFNENSSENIKQIQWAYGAWIYNTTELIYTPSEDTYMSVKCTSTGPIHYLNNSSLVIHEL